jgi:UDP-N-acetylglucosamine--N-acetylmuramyl-(pentapeptide) pyrophosphoryl-undecaprenol N-acetylglucosamine transferase
MAAALTGRPTLVMESNALPGWTNRMLARFVDRAAVSFTEALPYFRGKGKVTGNPVRKEFFEVPQKRREPGRFSLLVFGGSQGARAINESMVAALPKLNELRSVLRIKHQTGTADFEKVSAGYKATGWQNSATVVAYIDNMVVEVAEADLIVCRAGATTTAELIAAGKASIMIPFPFAADDHQTKNAEALQKAGGAIMIRQSQLTPEGLASEISRLVQSPEVVTEMEKGSKSLSHGDAAASVVDMITELTRNRRR